MLREEVIHGLAHRRLVITGGTGFFGKSILHWLKRNPIPGLEVVVLARHSREFANTHSDLLENPQYRVLQGDVRQSAIPELTQADFIIHAATPAASAIPDDEYRSIIIEGTENMLRLAEEVGVKRFLNVSSGAVYGHMPLGEEAFAESAPCHPRSVYGEGKLVAEELCRKSPLHTVSARCFAFVGPYLPQDGHFAIGNFIGDALAGKELLIRGDGMPLRSYLFADDLVEWLLTMLILGEDKRVYNVGSDKAISIAQLAELVRDILNPKGNIRILGSANPTNATHRYIPNIAAAQRELGLAVTIPLEEAIRRSAGR